MHTLVNQEALLAGGAPALTAQANAPSYAYQTDHCVVICPAAEIPKSRLHNFAHALTRPMNLLRLAAITLTGAAAVTAFPIGLLWLPVTAYFSYRLGHKTAEKMALAAHKQHNYVDQEINVFKGQLQGRIDSLQAELHHQPCPGGQNPTEMLQFLRAQAQNISLLPSRFVAKPLERHRAAEQIITETLPRLNALASHT